MGTRARSGGKGVSGRIVRQSPNGPQLVESKGRRWTDTAEARFLDELGASCNVTLAVEAAGFSTSTVYRRRRTDPGFYARWQIALTQGVERLEALLVQRATETMNGRAPDPTSPIPVMTVSDVIRVVQLHRSSVTGEGKRSGWRARPVALEDVRASIIAKLNAIEGAHRAAARSKRRGSDGSE